MFKGVIEGFYGRGWSSDERRTMLDWMAAAGMNTFIYAPKDDVHVRARWRYVYPGQELARLERLRTDAAERGIALIAAVAPCLDIVYSDPAELAALNARIDQMRAIGIESFALLFDDIPNRLPEADRVHFSSFARAQAHVANALMEHVRPHGGTVLFCPTEYCTRLAGGRVAASAYLRDLGESLSADIGVFWTGPEIVSREITARSLAEVGRVLGRKPIVWDNYHANDYDIRRVIAGPLGGRDRDILPLVGGYIANPNNELPANFVPVHTIGGFLADPAYDEGAALDAAIAAWAPQFELAFSGGKTLDKAQIRLLIDLFYQPFELGPGVARTIRLCQDALATPRPNTERPEWREAVSAAHNLKTGIGDLFTSMTELTDRGLFHTFHRYLWEAQEEITHLVSYLDWLDTNPAPNATFPADDRIPNFYRQGFGAIVQDMLSRDARGRYFHADC